MKLRRTIRYLRQYLICTAALLALSIPSHAASISNIQANSTSIAKYDRYEMHFNLTGTSPSDYNPFRPDTVGDSISSPGVDVWAQITTPSGKSIKVPAFWDVDFDYLGQIGDYGQGWSKYDKFVPASDPYWKVRYAPSEIGTYTVKLYATDQSGTTSSSNYQFTCVNSSLKGFINVAGDGQRLVYSNGDPFIPMGTSMKDDTNLQNTYLPQMQANGMNFIRYWITNGNMGDVHRENYPQSWTLTGGSYDTSAYRTGQRSISLSGSGSGIEEPFIGLRNGAYYRASAWIKTSPDFNGSAAVTLIVRYTDNSKYTYTGNTVGGGQNWTQSIVNFDTIKSGKTADFVSFQVKILSGSSGNAWVDDVDLYETNSNGSTKYNCNYLWNPSFEKWNPSQLRLWALWRLDRLLDQCEHYGVAVQTCIFDYRLWNPANPTGFYSQFFGDFWTDTASLAQQNRVLRYLAARYAGYRSLFSWELANEMDPSYTTVKDKWITDRSSFVRSNDPENHMVTNSYWSSPGSVPLNQLSAIDINQVHYYINTEERTSGQGVPGWWNQPAGVIIDKTSSNAHSGSNSLKFTANGSTLTAHENCYLKPNRSYTLIYWVKTVGVTGSANPIIRFYAPDGTEVAKSISLSNSGTSGYTMRQIAFTTASNCCRLDLTLQLTGSAGNAWYDDIQVIDDTNGRNCFYNGGFESPKFGDDEYEWGVYNTFNTRAVAESGPTGTRKPYISGEFGLMGANANLSGWADPKSSYPRHDNTGIHVHNCVWAELMATSALHGPSYWWTVEYLYPNNLLTAWKGVSVFLTKLPFYDRGQLIAMDTYLPDVKAASSNSQIRVLGQMKSNSAYIWVQNRQYSWSQVVRAGLNPNPASADITIPGFANGSYTVDWYDTNTGQLVRSDTRNVTAGALTISVSGLTTDIAAIIKPISITGDGGTVVGAGLPNISLSLAVDKSSAAPSDQVTHVVTYKNNGDAAASKLTILLPVPANATYVNGSANSGGVLDTSTNSIKWSISSVNPGASGQISAKFSVN